MLVSFPFNLLCLVLKLLRNFLIKLIQSHFLEFIWAWLYISWTLKKAQEGAFGGELYNSELMRNIRQHHPPPKLSQNALKLAKVKVNTQN